MKQKNIIQSSMSLLFVEMATTMAELRITNKFDNVNYETNLKHLYHDFEKLLEFGTYNDLIKFRAKYNLELLYWVRNDFDLELIKTIYNSKQQIIFNKDTI